MQRVNVPVELAFGDRLIEGSASIPAVLMRPADLLPVLQAVDEAVIGFAAELAGRNGQAISCREGCGACCRQLVPVSEAEARYLTESIEAMPAERQAQLRERFRQAVAQIPEPMLARLRDNSAADAAERTRLGEGYVRLGIPCPFLEQERCTIYQQRPMMCREYLVTSPAENCQTPTRETIATVPLPVRPSSVLFCFDDGIGKQATKWVPLTLLLEFVEARRGRPQPTFDAPQMFRNFIARVRAGVRTESSQSGDRRGDSRPLPPRLGS